LQQAIRMEQVINDMHVSSDLNEPLIYSLAYTIKMIIFLEHSSKLDSMIDEVVTDKKIVRRMAILRKIFNSKDFDYKNMITLKFVNTYADEFIEFSCIINLTCRECYDSLLIKFSSYLEWAENAVRDSIISEQSYLNACKKTQYLQKNSNEIHNWLCVNDDRTSLSVTIGSYDENIIFIIKRK
jgi:hypothetical protein